jgi:hypothetical protein
MRRFLVVKRVLIIVSLGMLFVLAIMKDANNTYSVVKTEHDLAGLKNMGITLRYPAVKPKIDKKTAIEQSRKAFGKQDDSKEKVKVEYQLITETGSGFTRFSEEIVQKYPKLENGLVGIPAYIVTFTGTSIPSSRVHENPHNEFCVLVDAMSGVVLEGFSYR